MSAVAPELSPLLLADAVPDVAQRRHDPVMLAAASVIVVLVVCAICAPLLAPYNPNGTNILSANQGPSSLHWLGTDSLGRDLLSRALYGARGSLFGPTLVILFTTTVGAFLAIAGVWYGGWIDSFIARFNDTLFAFPGLLLALLFVTFLGTGLVAPVIALTIAYTPYIYRVIRSVAVRERNLAYIESARVLGLSGFAVSFRHLLPNLTGMIRAQAALLFGAALADLAAVSYIGLGVQPPTPEWGLMVADGQSALINGYPTEALVAGTLIIVTVVAMNVIGQRLDVRARETL
jgi:peptide/nickel transport system permease protein